MTCGPTESHRSENSALTTPFLASATSPERGGPQVLASLSLVSGKLHSRAATEDARNSKSRSHGDAFCPPHSGLSRTQIERNMGKDKLD